jgi:hypothetical protein
MALRSTGARLPLQALRLITVLALALLVGCGGGGGGDPPVAGPGPSAGPGDVEGFFPDATGDAWYFDGTNIEQGFLQSRTFTSALHVVGESLASGRLARLFRETRIDDPTGPVDSHQIRDADQLLQLSSDDQNDPLLGAFLPIAQVKFPLAVGRVDRLSRSGVDIGEDLDGDGRNEAMTGTLETRVVGFEPLTVRVGSFPRTARTTAALTGRLQFSTGGSSDSFTVLETSWSAPGVGLVKRSTRVTSAAGDDSEEILEARGYLVEGTGRGISAPVVIAADLRDSNSDTDRPGRPGVAAGPDNYLVVTSQRTGYYITSQIGKWVGVRTDRAGNVLGTTDLSIGEAFLDGASSAAFNGTDYLAVFSRQEIEAGVRYLRGQRLSPAGVALDGPNGFVIADSVGSVAMASDGQDFLVVYTRHLGFDQLGTIYGRRISGAGQLLGSEFQISPSLGNHIHPAIAFDGSNYLVVWQRNQAGAGGGEEATAIAGARVTTSGVVLDPAAIAIAQGPGEQSYPSVAFGAGQYLVAWQDARAYPNNFNQYRDIRGARLSLDGVLIDGPPDSGGLALAVEPATRKLHVQVAYSGGQFVAAWGATSYFGLPGPMSGVYAAGIRGDGTVQAGPVSGFYVSGSPPGGGESYDWPVIVAGSAGSLLVWTSTDDGVTGGKNVRGMVIYTLL